MFVDDFVLFWWWSCWLIGLRCWNEWDDFDWCFLCCVGLVFCVGICVWLVLFGFIVWGIEFCLLVGFDVGWVGWCCNCCVLIDCFCKFVIYGLVEGWLILFLGVWCRVICIFCFCVWGFGLVCVCFCVRFRGCVGWYLWWC